MMTFILILAVLVAFVAGWLHAPKGTLTKITSAVWLAMIGGYEWLSEQFFMLKEIVPPEYSPWFIAGFLALTIAAAFRPAGKR